MLENLTLRGAKGSLVWGYRPVAAISTWSVSRTREDPKDPKSPWEWRLVASLVGPVDSFALRQRPLLFSAPRKGGFFTWPIRGLVFSEAPRSVSATLGPPEY